MTNKTLITIFIQNKSQIRIQRIYPINHSKKPPPQYSHQNYPFPQQTPTKIVKKR